MLKFSLKFLRSHYFLTKSLIRFMFSMMIHIGPKFCVVPSPPPRSCQGQGHRLIFFKFFGISLFLNQMIVPIWYHDRCWSKVFISIINTHDHDLVVEVTDLEFKMLKCFIKVFKTSLYPNLITNLIHLWYDDTYLSKILPSSVPTP